MIAETRAGVAQAVNAAMVNLYWQVGTRIRTEILKNQRAGDGKQFVLTLSRQLSWSHFIAILPVKDQLKRESYAEMCWVENWSVRTLRDKINGMLYERTALSRKPEELAKQEVAALRDHDKLTPGSRSRRQSRGDDSRRRCFPRIDGRTLTYRIAFTPSAKEDLRETRDWYDKDGLGLGGRLTE